MRRGKNPMGFVCLLLPGRQNDTLEASCCTVRQGVRRMTPSKITGKIQERNEERKWKISNLDVS